MPGFKQFLHRQFRKNEIAIHELNYLFWECTWRCNLACLHCGSDCTSSSNTPDMPFEDFLKAIAPLKNHYKPNTTTVAITGGEPLLRADLADCGRQLRQNGFLWGIVSNALFYDEAIHKELISAGMGSITISLDGMKDTHNWLRQNNKSFDQVIRALQLITRTPGLNYDVVTCVHPGNIPELEHIKALLIKHHVKAWRLFTIAPIGRAKENSNLRLSKEDALYLMDFISRSRKEEKIHVQFSCEAYVGKFEPKVRDSSFFCRAGINIASVLIDGGISACPNINRSFTQSSIYQDDLWEVWNSKFQCMRDRSWMKKGQCARCGHFKDCNGGAMHLWDGSGEGIVRCFLRESLGEVK